MNNRSSQVSDVKTCIEYNVDQIKDVAQALALLRKTCAIFTFTGSLGAGKTTLVQALLKECGIVGPITSPTFTYFNVYENSQGQKFYHFDCYRLTSLDDFLQAGFDEYLYQPNSWVFIEWPELIMPLLTHDCCHIAIEYKNEYKRILTYSEEDFGVKNG